MTDRMWTATCWLGSTTESRHRSSARGWIMWRRSWRWSRPWWGRNRYIFQFYTLSAKCFPLYCKLAIVQKIEQVYIISCEYKIHLHVKFMFRNYEWNACKNNISNKSICMNTTQYNFSILVSLHSVNVLKLHEAFQSTFFLKSRYLQYVCTCFLLLNFSNWPCPIGDWSVTAVCTKCTTRIRKRRLVSIRGRCSCSTTYYW